jgi:hypothetical protein
MKIRMTALALVALASHAEAAVSIHQKAPKLSSSGGVSSFYPAGYERHIAESFTLAQAADLSAVRFWGSMAGSFPVQPTAFRISLWKAGGVSDNGIAGAPATLIFEQETLVTDARFAVQSEPGGLNRYDVDLGTTVSLNAGERYWFSVAGRAEPNTNFTWGWADSTGSSGHWGGYNIFSANSWFVIEPSAIFNGGLAFELFAIPSPAATSLLALAAVAVRRRR